MREPPGIDDEDAENYDFRKMQSIVSALDNLRQEAAKTGVDDIATMIDSAFKIVLTTYILVRRYSCTNDFSPFEQIQ